MKDKRSDIEITELFMAKRADDFSQCFFGTIRRATDINGNPVVYGKIKVQDGYICAMASDQWELGKRLDDMVLIVLEMGLHSGEEYSTPNGKISLN